MAANFISMLGLVALALASPAPLPPSPLSWEPATGIVTGKGTKGPWRQNQSDYDYVDDPSAAIQPDHIAVAWVEQSRKDVFFQRLSRDGLKRLGRPINVSRSPATFSWIPRVVVPSDATDRIFIVWQEIIFSGGSHGGDILFARSTDNGKTFSTPINLSRSLGGDGKGRINEKVWSNGSFDIETGPGGKVVIAWTEYDGPLWVARSTDGGITFSRPKRVAGGPGELPVRGPDLAWGQGSTLFLAWTHGENAGADIRLQKSTDDGLTFGPALAMATTKGYSDSPAIAWDARGVLHAAFAESGGGPFDRYVIRYARSKDMGRTFEAWRTVSSPEPESTKSSGYPDVAVAGDDVIVTWELYPNAHGKPRGLGMAVSRDAGTRFTKPAIVPQSADPGGGSNGSHQGLLMTKLAMDESGLVAIVNSSLAPNDKSRVWLMTGKLPSAPKP